MPPVIDPDKCEGCGECVNICPTESIEIANEKAVVVKADECTECQACEAACPNGAISFP
jgi:NAD-dependent dihydropyrimidine dehydrogenase PreA subunit